MPADSAAERDSVSQPLSDNATLAAAGERRIDVVDPGYWTPAYVDWHYADQQLNPQHQRGLALHCLDCEAVNPHRTRKATR